MKENEQENPILTQVVNEVGNLYRGERSRQITGDPIPDESDQRWKQTATQFPPYKNQIETLWERLKTVEAIRKIYSSGGVVFTVYEAFFGNIQDVDAQAFLTDMLVARMILPSGDKIDYQLSAHVVELGTAMLKEMDVAADWQSEEVKNIPLEQAIGAVLTGDLKMSYQGVQKKRS